MADDESSIFDDAEESDQLPNEGPQEEDDSSEDLGPSLSDLSPKERLEKFGKKEKADGRILTVKACSLTRPRLKDSQGNTIPPKETMTSKKPFYPGKLAIKFEEDNLIEYVPSIHYFVNDGKVNLNVRLPRTGNSQIALLFDLTTKKMGKPLDEISDGAVLKFLVGKKVKIKTTSGKFQGKDWFRNDIIEIL